MKAHVVNDVKLSKEVGAKTVEDYLLEYFGASGSTASVTILFADRQLIGSKGLMM